MSGLELVLGGAVAFYAAGLAYDRFEIYRNRLFTSGRNHAKVLINLGFLMEFGSIPFTSYRAHIARRLTKLDIRADWKYAATSDDLREAIKDAYYQTIVIMGHEGKTRRNNWVAKDCQVTAEMVKDMMSNGVLKKGYWFQYTCGANVDGPFPGHHVMRDKSRVLGYDKKVSMWGMSFKKPTRMEYKSLG